MSGLLNLIPNVLVPISVQEQLSPCGNLILRNANIVHSRSPKQLEFLRNQLVIVREGKIAGLLDDSEDYTTTRRGSIQRIFGEDHNFEIPEITLSSHEFLIPGFVDTHAHAPQFAFTGTGLDLPLLDWLNKYTFPCESRFTDLDFAREVYTKSIETHLKNGTTTIAYYGTIHVEATKLLASLLTHAGIRAFVGKVCMDRNSPDFYVEESAEQSIEDTLAFLHCFLKDGKKIRSQLVQPILTPRFAPTCSPELMSRLGTLSKEYSLPIQTHLSENKAEVEWVKNLFPECSSYTEVYDRYGLLTPNTVLAHCIYLEDSEIELISQRQSGIAHCPNSNCTLQSGMMTTRRYMERGLKVGLGTDVAGGYSPSMLDAIRSCVAVSKFMFIHSDRKWAPLTLPEAFWLATRGGAQVLGLEDRIGHFSSGMEFDALIVDYSNLDCWIDNKMEPEEIFEKMIYLMDDRHIRRAFVRGRQVK